MFRLTFDNKFKQTDRERMLTFLAYRFKSDAVLGRSPARAAREGRGGRDDDHYDAPWCTFDDKPQKGDLVNCSSVRCLHFRFAWFLGFGSDFFLVRELGGPRIMNIVNDTAYRVNMPQHHPIFLEGAEFEHYRKIEKAGYIVDDWTPIRGIEFSGEREWGRRGTPTVIVGKRHRELTKRIELSSDWTPKTTIKSIAAELKEKGFAQPILEPAKI